MRLAYFPQNGFFVMDTNALYARAVGEQTWNEHPYDDLPHFRDRIADRDWVWTAPGAKPPENRSTQSSGGDARRRPPARGYRRSRVRGFCGYPPEETRVVASAEGLRPLIGFP